MKFLMISLILLFTMPVYGADKCNAFLQKTVKSLIQCEIVNLKSGKDTYVNAMPQNPSAMQKRFNNFYISHADSAIEIRKQIIEAMNAKALSSEQARKLMIDIEDQEKKSASEYMAIEQERNDAQNALIDSQIQSLQARLARPDAPVDLGVDIACEPQNYPSGSVRCRQK